MAISDQLTLLNNTKTAIRTAINSKGGSVGASDTFASYATAIVNLPSGGDDSVLRDLIERDIASITIPSGTTSIGNNVFSFCSSLTSVTIPNSVTTIGNAAFQGCTSFTSITIPNNVTSIGNFAFQSCTSLTSVTIPNNVTSIGNNAFDYCTSLTSATIGNSVTSIGDAAFNACTSLTSIIIPSSVTTIGSRAFQGCSSLTSVTLNATTPPTIGGGTYYGSFNGTYPIYVPAASVDAYKAASNWSTYASRIYPIQQVATVDGNPVYNYDLGMASTDTITSENMAKMPSGTSVEFAEGLTNIAAGEINYQEVILPSTFTGFGDSDMIGSNVTTITSNAVTPPSAFRNQLGGSGLTAIYVPAASVDTYKAHAAWSGFASIIQAIPVPLMAEITLSDESVYEIPYDGVGVLDENNVPFDDALAQATDIHITSYATAIGQPYELDGAYYGVFEGDGSTDSLKTVTIDEGLTAIPNQAFASNVGLTTVTLPSTITSIGDYAFGVTGGGVLGPMSFTIHATTPPTLGTDSVGVANGRLKGKFYVPAASVDTYKAAAGWSNWAKFIEAIPSE